MIYFDNGATTFPKPASVIEAVRQAMEIYGANPGRSGHKLSLDAAVKVFECREAVAQMFGAENVEDVVFTSNCTHAINFALKGLLKNGDHVIISDLEHNSVLRPIHELAVRGIITYSIATVDETDDKKTVESFRWRIRPNTKLIACTHASNAFGVSLPIEKIGKLADAHDILFLVDAAQTAGIVPIDMRKNRIDFLCAPGHKSLYGPPGTGFLITPLGNALDTVFEGGTGSMSADYGQPTIMPDRLESGTVNTSGIIGLNAGISYVREKGIDTIYRQSMQVAGDIHEGLKKISNITLYTEAFIFGRHLPVVSFNIKDMPSENAASAFSDLGFALRGGLHCAPLAHKKMGTIEMGAVRASIGSFNTREEARQFLAAAKQLAE